MNINYEDYLNSSAISKKIDIRNCRLRHPIEDRPCTNCIYRIDDKSCKAFPNANIPKECIMYDWNPHSHKLPDQIGDYVFEPHPEKWKAAQARINAEYERLIKLQRERITKEYMEEHPDAVLTEEDIDKLMNRYFYE